MKRSILVLALLLLVGALAAREERPILIQNGTIVPVTGKPIPGGSLLIEKGKITRIGVGIQAPPNAQVIDAAGKWVYPGMVAPLTAIGLTGYPGSGSDTNEVGTSTPQMDPYDAINPEDDCIDVARMEGVTTVLTAAGSSKVINGKAIALDLEGNLPEEMLLRRDVLQVFNLGARTQGRYPSTIPGIMAFLREKLDQARVYADRAKSALGGDSVRRDLELDALVPVVKRETPVLFVTSDEVTIRNALQLMEEFGLKGILFASADIVKFADQLASKRIPVIWGGTTTMPRRWEPVDTNFRAAGLLAQKGVLFALSESRGLGSRNSRRQTVPASISVAYGLPEEEAIRALTIYPARILGLDDKVGSLEVGKIANVVVCTKSLIQQSNRVEAVIIGGRPVPLESVQTRLYDKYRRIVSERLAERKKAAGPKGR